MWNSFFELLGDLWYDESGTVVIEYGMLAMVVAMAILGAMQLTATNLSAMFQNTVNAFPN